METPGNNLFINKQSGKLSAHAYGTGVLKEVIEIHYLFVPDKTELQRIYFRLGEPIIDTDGKQPGE